MPSCDCACNGIILAPCVIVRPGRELFSHENSYRSGNEGSRPPHNGALSGPEPDADGKRRAQRRGVHSVPLFESRASARSWFCAARGTTAATALSSARHLVKIGRKADRVLRWRFARSEGRRCNQPQALEKTWQTRCGPRDRGGRLDAALAGRNRRRRAARDRRARSRSRAACAK